MRQEIGRNRSGLRYGYTTGSCAAAASKAAAAMLLGKEEITHVKLMTPKGIELYLEVESTVRTADYVQCAVSKYSGDDPDVTDGMKVYARVEKSELFLGKEEDTARCFEIGERLILAGGEGVGRVTKAGLEQKEGFPAINKIPRKMIAEAVEEECENIGETIDDAKLLGMKGILLIGHIGKFVKLAAGVMNTHSRQADCRMEVLAVHAALAGAETSVVRSVMECINTSEALELLKRYGFLEKVMKSVMDRVEFYLTNRAGETLEIGAVVFSNEEGILGKTSKADELFDRMNRSVTHREKETKTL